MITSASSASNSPHRPATHWTRRLGWFGCCLAGALAFSPPAAASSSYSIVDPSFGLVDSNGQLGEQREAAVAADVRRQALIAEQAPVYHHVRARDVLGEGRMRDLDSARYALAVSDDDPLFQRSLRDDPLLFEETRDALLSAYLKLQRESLAQAIGFGAWEDRRRARRESKRAAAALEKSRWSLRVSPRLDLGSSESMGVKVRMPYTGTRLFDSLSFRSRYDLEDGRQSYYLKFDDGDRFVFLGYSQDEETMTDQVDLSIRIWF